MNGTEQEIMTIDERSERDAPEPVNLVRVGGEELDVQITTAKRYPRSIRTFKMRALSMATVDRETAESCFYVLPRGGKKIEGPGVRLSEIVQACWQNLYTASRVIGESDDRKSIVAQGVAWDLENNVRRTVEIRRRITDKHNKRYTDDMVIVTGNAAASIAVRNAIFQIVPRAYVDEVYLSAKQLAVGDAKSLSDRRVQVIERLAKFGITPARVLDVIGKPAIEDIDLSDVEKLIGLGTAMRDGEISPDEAFPMPSGLEQKKPETLQEKVAAKAAGKTADREPGDDIDALIPPERKGA